VKTRGEVKSGYSHFYFRHLTCEGLFNRHLSRGKISVFSIVNLTSCEVSEPVSTN
jgi:hypothetical protein